MMDMLSSPSRAEVARQRLIHGTTSSKRLAARTLASLKAVEFTEVQLRKLDDFELESQVEDLERQARLIARRIEHQTRVDNHRALAVMASIAAVPVLFALWPNAFMVQLAAGVAFMVIKTIWPSRERGTKRQRLRKGVPWL